MTLRSNLDIKDTKILMIKNEKYYFNMNVKTFAKYLLPQKVILGFLYIHYENYLLVHHLFL